MQVIADNTSGLLFKNKRDRKIINVDPKVTSCYMQYGLWGQLSLVVALLILPGYQDNTG